MKPRSRGEENAEACNQQGIQETRRSGPGHSSIRCEYAISVWMISKPADLLRNPKPGRDVALGEIGDGIVDDLVDKEPDDQHHDDLHQRPNESSDRSRTRPSAVDKRHLPWTCHFTLACETPWRPSPIIRRFSGLVLSQSRWSPALGRAPLKLDQRIGGAYCRPPLLHSAFLPRAILSGVLAPTLRSKISP